MEENLLENAVAAVFCSFLALVLRKALKDRLEARGYSFEWVDILLDLNALTEVEVSHNGKRLFAAISTQRLM